MKTNYLKSKLLQKWIKYTFIALFFIQSQNSFAQINTSHTLTIDASTPAPYTAGDIIQVNMSGSQTGYSYQLFTQDGTKRGGLIAGTGSAISFTDPAVLFGTTSYYVRGILTTAAASNPNFIISENTKVLHFENADDFGTYNDDLPQIPWSTSMTVTLETWVFHPSGDTSTSTLMGTQDEFNNNLFFTKMHLRLSNGNVTALSGDPTTSGVAGVRTINASVPRDQWFHVAFVINGVNTHLYVDGILVGSSLNSVGDGVRPTSDFRIGKDLTGNLNSSKMAGTRIWTVARTAAQIAADRNTKFTSVQSGLFAAYTYDNVSTGFAFAQHGSSGRVITLLPNATPPTKKTEIIGQGNAGQITDVTGTISVGVFNTTINTFNDTFTSTVTPGTYPLGASVVATHPNAIAYSFVGTPPTGYSISGSDLVIAAGAQPASMQITASVADASASGYTGASKTIYYSVANSLQTLPAPINVASINVARGSDASTSNAVSLNTLLNTNTFNGHTFQVTNLEVLAATTTPNPTGISTDVTTPTDPILTVLNPGTFILRLTLAGDSNFAQGVHDITVNVTGGTNQAASTFPAIASVALSGTHTIPATTSTGNLTLAYTSSNTAVATVSGNEVTNVSLGTTTLTATSTGDYTYFPFYATQNLEVIPDPFANNSVVSIDQTTGNAETAVTISVTNTQLGYTYYLLDATTDLPIAGVIPIAGTGGTINFPHTAFSTTNYKVGAVIYSDLTGNSFQKVQNGLQFNEIGYVDIPAGLSTGFSTTATLETWAFIPTSDTSASKIVGLFTDTFTSNSLQLSLFLEGGNLYAGSFSAGWARVAFPSIPTDRWAHLAVQYSANAAGTSHTFNLYVDGVFVASGSGANTGISTNANWRLGARWDFTSTNDVFGGQLANTRLWNTTRTQQEISSNMTNVFTSVQTGLLANYTFAEGTGTTVANVGGSVSGIDGTLTGATVPTWSTNLNIANPNATILSGTVGIIITKQAPTLTFADIVNHDPNTADVVITLSANSTDTPTPTFSYSVVGSPAGLSINGDQLTITSGTAQGNYIIEALAAETTTHLSGTIRNYVSYSNNNTPAKLTQPTPFNLPASLSYPRNEIGNVIDLTSVIVLHSQAGATSFQQIETNATTPIPLGPISGANLTVQNPGVYTLRATSAENTNFAQTSFDIPVTITGGTAQTITLPADHTVPPTPNTYNPIANSDAPASLVLSYTSSNTSVATVPATGNTVTLIGSGTTVLTATQAGDFTYTPLRATQNLVVTDPVYDNSYTLTANPAIHTNSAPFNATVTLGGSQTAYAYTLHNSVSGGTETVVAGPIQGTGNPLDFNLTNVSISGLNTYRVSATAVTPESLTSNAIQFNDVGDISVPSGINSNFSANNITLETWTFIPAGDLTASDGFNLIGGSLDNNKVTYAVFIENERLHAGFYDTVWNRTAGISAGQFPTDQWFHVAATFDGTTHRLYINSVLIASQTSTVSTLPSTPTTNWVLGKNYNPSQTGVNNLFSGRLANTRVWNSVRTPFELKSDAVKTYTPTEAQAETNLVLHYTYDSNLTDTSSTPYSGTATGLAASPYLTGQIGTLLYNNLETATIRYNTQLTLANDYDTGALGTARTFNMSANLPSGASGAFFGAFNGANYLQPTGYTQQTFGQSGIDISNQAAPGVFTVFYLIQSPTTSLGIINVAFTGGADPVTINDRPFPTTPPVNTSTFAYDGVLGIAKGLNPSQANRYALKDYLVFHRLTPVNQVTYSIEPNALNPAGLSIDNTDPTNPILVVQNPGTFQLRVTTPAVAGSFVQGETVVDGVVSGGTDQTITGIAATLTKKFSDPATNLPSTTDQGLPISYTSSDPTVATVSSTGVVTHVGFGSTTITVSSQGGDYNFHPMNTTQVQVLTLTIDDFVQGTLTTNPTSAPAATPPTSVSADLANSQLGYRYTLFDDTGTQIGNPQDGIGGTLSFTDTNITATKTYTVRAASPTLQNALQFNDSGSVDFLNETGGTSTNLNAIFSNGTNITLETWAYIPSSDSDPNTLHVFAGIIADDLVAADAITYTLYIQDGEIAAGYFDGTWKGIGNIVGNTGHPIDANNLQDKWIHLAATYDASTGTHQLYVDGQLVRSAVNPSGAQNLPTSTSSWSLGKRWDDIGTLAERRFGGRLADTRIWKSTRTAQQVLDNRHNVIGSDPDLVVNYRYEGNVNDGSGVPVINGTSTGLAASPYLTNQSTNDFLSTQATLIITKPLRVTANDAWIDTGGTDPTFTTTLASTTPLNTGDVLHVPLVRVAGTTAGRYAINVDTTVKGDPACTNNGLCVLSSTGADVTDHYVTTFVPGTFVINDPATGVVWDGSNGTSWNDAANWSGNATPTNTVDVTIPQTVTNMPSVGASVNGEVRDLIVLNSTLTIPDNSSVTVTRNLDTQGTITIGSVGATSGVLLVEGTSTGTVTYERGGFTANTWSVVSAPVAGQKIKDFVENVANDIRVNTSVTPNRYAVAYYDDSQAVGSKWVYYDVDFLTANPNTEFEIGRSYAMSRATDGAVTFTGTLSVANVNKSVAASQWNAIGNPFTAFVPANQNSNNNFINDNTANFDPINVAVYVWDPSQNRYVARSLADVTATSLTPGQGFFIRTNTGVSSVSFNQDKRMIQPASGNTSFSRNSQIPSIQLLATLGSLTIDTSIKFFEHATVGLDPGYDVASFGGNQFDLYTKLLNGYQDVNFTIQSLPDSDFENLVVPIGLKAASGDLVSFSIDALHLPSGVEVYLEDRQENTFENLSIDNANYAITLDQDSNGVGRFYLHTQSSTLGNNDNPEFNGVHIFTLERRILRITGVEDDAKVKMYNILGTQVLDTSFTGNLSNDIALPYLKTGVYIVQLETNKGILNKKILVQ